MSVAHLTITIRWPWWAGAAIAIATAAARCGLADLAGSLIEFTVERATFTA